MKKIIPLLCLSLLGAADLHAAGRQNTVTGSIGVRQGYDSNVHRTADGEVEEWTTALTPTLGLTSASARDSLSVNYSPSVVYNHRLDETNLEHFLDLAARRSLSDRLQLSLTDTYELGDDSGLNRDDTGTRPDRIVLSENRGRNRYWSNSLTARINNEFARDSSLGLGYNHSLLDNSAPNEEDYQRHRPFASFDRRWSTRWSTGIDGSYSRGNFDQSDDLSEYTADLEQRCHLDPHRTITGSVGYTNAEYDGTTSGYDTWSFQAGYRTDLTAASTLAASAGWNTTARDNGGDEDGLAYSLDYQRRLEKGSFTLNGSGGFENQQFAGAGNGLSRYWTLGAGLRHQLAERLTADGRLQYRNDDYLDRQPSSGEKSWDAGGGLNWAFGRWYTASLRYLFREVNADATSDDYTDHRLFFALSAGRDLWKW